MALVVSPESGTQSAPEFSTIELTVSCVDLGTPGDPVPITDPPTPPNPDVPGPAVVILTATCADPGITVTHTDTTFTVSGTFSDVLKRELRYRDKNNELVTIVGKFLDIPPDFNSLITYHQPSPTTGIGIVNVSFMNHSNLAYAINVPMATAPANAMLQQTVAKGVF